MRGAIEMITKEVGHTSLRKTITCYKRARNKGRNLKVLPLTLLQSIRLVVLILCSSKKSKKNSKVFKKMKNNGIVANVGQKGTPEAHLSLSQVIQIMLVASYMPSLPILTKFSTGFKATAHNRSTKCLVNNKKSQSNVQ